jgi:uncharacterized Rmd1/YagE family protein
VILIYNKPLINRRTDLLFDFNKIRTEQARFRKRERIEVLIIISKEKL